MSLCGVQYLEMCMQVEIEIKWQIAEQIGLQCIVGVVLGLGCSGWASIVLDNKCPLPGDRTSGAGTLFLSRN